MVAVLKKYMVKQQNKTSLVKSIVEEEERSTSSGLESYNNSLNNSLSSSEESGVDLGKSAGKSEIKTSKGQVQSRDSFRVTLKRDGTTVKGTRLQ